MTAEECIDYWLEYRIALQQFGLDDIRAQVPLYRLSETDDVTFKAMESVIRQIDEVTDE